MNGLLHTLPFKTPLQPYATWFTLCVISILTLTNGFQVFWPKQWSASSFLAAYITIPIFLVLYLGHKAWFRTSIARPLHEIDVLGGKEKLDREEEVDRANEVVPSNWLEKFWYWLA